jgi:hypothetical protein
LAYSLAEDETTPEPPVRRLPMARTDPRVWMQSKKGREK